MKMRTLGRHHTILKHLSDGNPKRRRDLGHGIGTSDMHALQTLLIRGLVNRIPEDIEMQGWYLITEAGKKAFERLEALQSLPENISNELRWFGGSRPRNIAHRGYHWVDVDCPMSSYWMRYFEAHIW